MKANRPYRNFMLGMGAMIFMALATHADAHQLGAVQFANGSTHPTKISRYLLDQAKASTSKPGQVILLRAGASPVGGAAYNFVLSGERAARVRNALVKAGIPRKKIVSDFVGIVHRGSAAKDRAVIVDATTRQALASGGKQVATPQATPAQVRKLQSEIEALQAAAKPARVRNWEGGAFYLSRTASVNSTTTIPQFGSGPLKLRALVTPITDRVTVFLWPAARFLCSVSRSTSGYVASRNSGRWSTRSCLERPWRA